MYTVAKYTDKTSGPDKGEISLYRSPDRKGALDVRLEQETVLLNRCHMAELFDEDTDIIGPHIRNIYKEGELTRKGTTQQSSVVQNEGGRQVRRRVNFYNLDVIISVGYLADIQAWRSISNLGHQCAAEERERLYRLS